MQINKIYNFLFYPLSHKDYSSKMLSTITVVALSVLSKGIFAIAFVFVHWRRYKMTPTIENAKVNQAITLVLKKDRKPKMPSISHPVRVLKEEVKMDQTKVDLIKRDLIQQLQKFEKWAQANEWQSIHDAHYDWWMFPVERPSAAYGETYAVSKAEVEALKADPIFMNHYRRGVALVVQAWGWDLEKGEAIKPAAKGQAWDGYGVRLAKMSDSLRLFGEIELHQKLKVFFNQHCLPQQKEVPISDLSWLKRTLGVDLGTD